MGQGRLQLGRSDSTADTGSHQPAVSLAQMEAQAQMGSVQALDGGGPGIRRKRSG